MLSCIWKPSEEVRGAKQRALVYFVCGNPGLIGFYVDFLDALRSLLDSSAAGATAYDLYGANLAGFCDDEHEPFGPDNPPLDVHAQVDATYRDVASRRVSSPGGGPDGGSADDKPYDLVILMGHSIGAYICVEIFHRHLRDASRAPHLRLRHGFLLFPTIASLAASQAGTRLNRLRGLPTVDAHFATYAGALLGLLPQRALQWLVEKVLRFSPRAAGVTAEWLKSRDGVLQAFHMAKSELDDILEDTWEDALWEASGADDGTAGGSTTGPRAPRFFMFYGRQDHWVADHVRDEFIARRRRRARAGKKGTTSITVDEGNIAHAFCTREGVVVRWLRQARRELAAAGRGQIIIHGFTGAEPRLARRCKIDEQMKMRAIQAQDDEQIKMRTRRAEDDEQGCATDVTAQVLIGPIL
ncbi:hypothetical protein UVI_02012450 [Ustilaginoidea virens]|uniref:Lipid droplet-associated hydrolase n=1 Tax=Ustilaginoidea virens TaxID=1159556 RepID=A0A1B5KZS4_USTVR|nr:hypothetical protein UVI_02012450 [Ustilaginoidea virens]